MAGLEPARPNGHRILSPACLPIPPHQQLNAPDPIYLGGNTSVNEVVYYNLDLTKNADVYRHSRSSEKRDSNPRPPPWQGGALPTELFSQKIFKIVAQTSKRVQI